MRRLLPLLFLGALFLAGCAGRDPSSLEGSLLVARPNMAPNLFSRTVVLLMKHDANGAFGFILNRPGGDAKLSELLTDLGSKLPASMPADPGIPMHLGGPVEIGTLFVLHSADIETKDAIAAAGRYVMSPPIDTLERMAESGKQPSHIRLMLGYSGWGAGQLEAEIARGDWEVVAPSDDLVFGQSPPLAQWERAWEKRAIGL